MGLALDGFFVLVDVGGESFGGDAGQGGEWAVEVDDAAEFGGDFGGEVAGDDGEVAGGEHAVGDGFAVEEEGVVRFRFEGVAEGVAVVENAAEAAFLFVSGDDGSFDADAFVNNFFENFRVLGEDVGGAVGEDGEEFGAGDDAVFDDFEEASAVFAGGERVEDGGVDEDGVGLVEGAEEVLAALEVDAGFAADGGVDLGKESGGDLDDGDAAHEDGGEEAADVAADAAAEGDEDAGSVCAAGEHLVGEGFENAEAFVGFAAGEVEDFETGEVIRVEGVDVRGGYDEDLAGTGGQEFANF